MALDFVLLTDLSGSYSGDLPTIKSSGTSLFNSLKILEGSSFSRFGVTSFVDKPVDPFGDSASGDYVYTTDRKLTGDASIANSALQALSPRYGGDGPEAQLEALMQAAIRQTEVGYAAGSNRFILVAIDVMYHTGAAPRGPARSGSPGGSRRGRPS